MYFFFFLVLQDEEHGKEQSALLLAYFQNDIFDVLRGNIDGEGIKFRLFLYVKIAQLL